MPGETAVDSDPETKYGTAHMALGSSNPEGTHESLPPLWLSRGNWSTLTLRTRQADKCGA